MLTIHEITPNTKLDGLPFHGRTLAFLHLDAKADEIKEWPMYLLSANFTYPVRLQLQHPIETFDSFTEGMCASRFVYAYTVFGDQAVFHVHAVDVVTLQEEKLFHFPLRDSERLIYLLGNHDGARDVVVYDIATGAKTYYPYHNDDVKVQMGRIWGLHRKNKQVTVYDIETGRVHCVLGDVRPEIIGQEEVLAFKMFPDFDPGKPSDAEEMNAHMQTAMRLIHISDGVELAKYRCFARSYQLSPDDLLVFWEG